MAMSSQVRGCLGVQRPNPSFKGTFCAKAQATLYLDR